MTNRRTQPRILLLASLLAAGLLAACAPWPQRPPEANSYAPAETTRANEIVQLATHELGTPYVYGGDTTHGFDCSGLVYYVFTHAGVAVPRTANRQLYASYPVGLQDLRPGDLVFFQIVGNIQMHVGIYVGDGVFIHAPETGRPVSYARLDDPYWKSRFVGGGRF